MSQRKSRIWRQSAAYRYWDYRERYVSTKHKANSIQDRTLHEISPLSMKRINQSFFWSRSHLARYLPGLGG